MSYILVKDKYPYYQYKKATKKSKGTIFFIHGYAVNSEYHNNFSDMLEDYDYYAVEHAGHGITPLKDKKQLNPYEYAKDVVNLINELNLENIILIGHSMGGGIAVMVSQMIPEKIKKMIIVTPMNSKGTTNPINFLFKFNPKNKKQIEKFYDIIMYDWENDKDKISKKEIDTVIKSQNENKHNFSILKRRMASISNMKRLSKNERSLKIPTLLLVGKGDGCINWKTTSKNFRKKNGDIQIYVFEKCGHIPFAEDKDLYFKVIMDFINE